MIPFKTIMYCKLHCPAHLIAGIIIRCNFAPVGSMTRLNATISPHFYHPTLKAQVEHIASTSEVCQHTTNYLVWLMVNFHLGMHCYYHGQEL